MPAGKNLSVWQTIYGACASQDVISGGWDLGCQAAQMVRNADFLPTGLRCENSYSNFKDCAAFCLCLLSCLNGGFSEQIVLVHFPTNSVERYNHLRPPETVMIQRGGIYRRHVVERVFSWTGQARPSQARPGQARPGQARPGQDRPGQARPGQARTGQDRTGQPHGKGRTLLTDWISHCIF